MRVLRNLSIRAKLNALVLVTSGAALLLATVALLFNEASAIRDSRVQQLSSLAKILGANSTAALTFDDAAAARELLSSLSLQPPVRFACLYDVKGRAFATYRGRGVAEFSPPPPGPEGHAFVAGNRLDITQDVFQGNERVGTVCLQASLDDLDKQILHQAIVVAAVMSVSLAVALLLSSRLQRMISAPVLGLAEAAQQISATRDYSVRVQKHANDELGTLYDEFNGMLGEIERGQKDLERAHAELEMRVEERTRQLSQANRELSKEIAERQRAEQDLEVAHQQLLDTARRAGMAEVATGVLHNVGNVLNSINVSATLVTDRLRGSRVGDLTRALDLLKRHAEDLGRFFTEDEKGRQLPHFLDLVASRFVQDRQSMLDEMKSLTKNVDHVKTIVAMQQSYAGAAGLVETVALADLAEDALRLNHSSFGKYEITVVRDYGDGCRVRVDKQKLLQILINLLRNAKDALVESEQKDRRLTVRIRPDTANTFIEVADNGVGIAKENLTRIFSHGFTTKKNGHGFGLHSSANAAKELGGALTAQSDGPGTGATFILELPLNLSEVRP